MEFPYLYLLEVNANSSRGYLQQLGALAAGNSGVDEDNEVELIPTQIAQILLV